MLEIRLLRNSRKLQFPFNTFLYFFDFLLFSRYRYVYRSRASLFNLLLFRAAVLPSPSLPEKPIEPPHDLPLPSIRLELFRIYSVLVGFATGLVNVTDVKVRSAPCEALIEKSLVVVISKFARSKAQLVIL
jgi:hypothetical protein